MKKRIYIDYDDAPSLVPSGNHLLEVVTVRPFKQDTKSGWVITFRSVENPVASFQAWLTLEVGNEKSLYWQVEKTAEFLVAAGLGHMDKESVTHRDLIGVKLWCWVVKKANKRGEFVNVIKKYHREKPEGEE